MKIMFICTGNICRSAMAHAMLEKMTKEENKNIEVYSSGIFAQNGDIPTEEAIKTMQKYNVELKNHRAINIKDSNIKEMNIILCATTSHKNNVINMYPDLKDKTYTIKEYAGYPNNDLDIKDPWGYGTDVYEKCAEEIANSLKQIVKLV